LKNKLKLLVIIIIVFLGIQATSLSNGTEAYDYVVKDEMILVKGGEFVMGGTVGDGMGYALPIHMVKLTNEQRGRFCLLK